MIKELRPNVQRAKNAIILIWIMLALEVVSLISGYFQYDLLNEIAKGEIISTEEANANDNRELIVGFFYTIAYIVSAVMFIQWFRRAYYNLHQKVNRLLHSEGWAAGAWFVPIVNLYRPYLIMKELYRETKDILVKNEISFSRKYLTDILLAWWWVLWISNNFYGQIVLNYSMKAETVDELITMTEKALVSNIIGVLLALITIKVIKDYSDMESLLNKITDKNVVTAHNIGLENIPVERIK